MRFYERPGARVSMPSCPPEICLSGLDVSVRIALTRTDLEHSWPRLCSGGELEVAGEAMACAAGVEKAALGRWGGYGRWHCQWVCYSSSTQPGTPMTAKGLGTSFVAACQQGLRDCGTWSEAGSGPINEGGNISYPGALLGKEQEKRSHGSHALHE